MSGHTHGGQVGLISWDSVLDLSVSWCLRSRLVPQAGLLDVCYEATGTGLPPRLGISSEIALIDVHFHAAVENKAGAFVINGSNQNNVEDEQHNDHCHCWDIRAGYRIVCRSGLHHLVAPKVWTQCPSPQQQSSSRRNRGERFLKQRGFKILIDSREDSNMLVDGERVSFEVRADLLVRKRFKTYIAEVKTGQLAPDPSAAQTRRQLLEYSLIFQEHGLLLVDMETKRSREITFHD